MIKILPGVWCPLPGRWLHHRATNGRRTPAPRQKVQDLQHPRRGQGTDRSRWLEACALNYSKWSKGDLSCSRPSTFREEPGCAVCHGSLMTEYEARGEWLRPYSLPGHILPASRDCEARCDRQGYGAHGVVHHRSYRTSDRSWSGQPSEATDRLARQPFGLAQKQWLFKLAGGILPICSISI